MANILLDYFFKITAINPTPAASTAFLRQVCVVASPVGGYGGVIGVPVLCTTNAQIALVTANTEAQQLLAGGLSRVYIMPVNDLDLADFLESAANQFFTLLISSDFDKDDINDTQATLTLNGDLTFTAVNSGSSGNDITITLANTATAGAETCVVTGTDIVVGIQTATSTATQIKAKFDATPAAVALATCTIVDGQGAEAQASATETPLADGDGLFLGTFDGVTGVVSNDTDFLADQAAIENRCAFYESGSTNGKNMMYAFGKLLANTLDWKNQQYITMPFSDDVSLIGTSETLFDDKISFVINDDEFNNRLALMCAGGKAITAPYILRNLEIDMQSKALQYVTANQPAYTRTQASLIENELQKVIDGDGQENGNPGYVGKGWITSGSVDIRLEQDNFVASGYIDVPTPKALWRIAGQLTQS